MHMHMLHCDLLLALAAVAVERVQQHRVGARELVIGQKEKDIDEVSPIAPAIVQPSNDGEAMMPAPPISAYPSQGHLDTEEGKSALIRRRNDLRRSSAHDNRAAPLGSPHDRNGTQAVKGFWDWSR
jgi:hypothetical protein